MHLVGINSGFFSGVRRKEDWDAQSGLDRSRQLFSGREHWQ